MALDPVVRSFDNLEAVERARAALLERGFDPDGVDMRVIQDEAGPVEGNFVIGNGRTVHGREPGPVLGGPDVPYEDNFHQTVARGVHLLIVHATGAASRELAARTLEQHGGVDPQARAAQGALSSD